MNEGARDANDANRHRREEENQRRIVMLLAAILSELRWHFRDDPNPDGDTPQE